MARIGVSRHRGDLDVVRTAFGRRGVLRGECRKGDATVTYRAPGAVEISREDFDRVYPWLRGQEMPTPWRRLAQAAEAAGSRIVEHTPERLVIDDAA